MPKLSVYNFLSLDGYYKDAQGEIAWHKHGADEAAFSAEQMKQGNTLIFGRVTYEMMASFWTTPMAMETSPVVAKGMNEALKVMFSRTLTTVDWKNTRIATEPLETEIRNLKKTAKKNMTVLGSGSLVTQLAELGLVDEFGFMIDPVALGDGASLFKGLKKQLGLKLTGTRSFKSGTVLLTYIPTSN